MRRTSVISRFIVLKTLILLFTSHVVLFTGCSSVPDNEEVVLFKDITVIDAVNGLRTNQSVIVSGDKIVESGRVDEVSEPSGATVIDGSGRYMIPGLWDAHVHLTNTAAMRSYMLPLLLVNGITYVRDTSASLDAILPLRKEAEEASLLKGMAPGVFISGPHIESSQISWESSVRADTVEEAEEWMNTLLDAGVDEIKVYDLLSPEIYHRVLSIAEDKGYNVSAHVPMAMDVVEASNAGLASMEHMGNLEFSLSSDWQLLLEDRRRMIAEGADKTGRELRGEIYREQRLHAIQTQDEERRRNVLNTLAENNTWQVPTLTLTALAEHRLYARDDWKETWRYLPQTVRSDWEESAASLENQTPSEIDLAHADWAYDMIPRLAGAGVGIMAGTDMPLVMQTPGFSLHEELALLVRSGLSPIQAIEAATLRPAQYFGLENRQGAISVDMKADLVLLDANPLDDITNTRQIHAVMRDGHLHTRADLDRILERMENGD